MLQLSGPMSITYTVHSSLLKFIRLLKLQTGHTENMHEYALLNSDRLPQGLGLPMIMAKIS